MTPTSLAGSRSSRRFSCQAVEDAKQEPWHLESLKPITSGFGFIVDYVAGVLRLLRNQDSSHAYAEHLELNSEITTRDRDGVQKAFAGGAGRTCAGRGLTSPCAGLFPWPSAGSCRHAAAAIR